MKKLLLAILIILLPGIFKCSFAQTNNIEPGTAKPIAGTNQAGNNTEQELKQITQSVKAAAMRGDKKSFESYLADDYFFTTQDGKIVTRQQLLENFKTTTIPDHTDMEYTECRVQDKGNLAVMSSRINQYDSSEQKTIRAMRATDLFIKERGQWKILSQHISEIPLPGVENILNSSGYKLLEENKINEAIEVFKLNIKLHPQAWNPYDSLGEAYALAGNKALAIENYEMSIKLHPANENGKKMLAKLKAK